jgi:phosphoesterase RecJ-like protein
MKRDGKLVWTLLTLADRKAVKYPGRDDADLINIMSEINDAEVAVIFIEQENGSVKVSWRTRTKINVSRIAKEFGGGGHVAAAGAMIRGELQEVQEKVIQMTKSMLDF